MSSLSIADLPALIATLAPQAQARFRRIFRVDVSEGVLHLTPELRAWAQQRFGDWGAVERQRVIRVTNRVTLESAAFNPLRARRPLPMSDAPQPLQADEDIFADPLRTTPADVFGRAQGAHCITASNIARWEGWGSVVIFDEPDIHRLTAAHLCDCFRVSLEWACRAHAYDPQARFFLWTWNAGLKAGASISHAHAQVALARGTHYAGVERLRRDAQAYRRAHGIDYFADLFAAHADVGLTFRLADVSGLVYLTPLRPRETWLLANALDDALANALHTVIRTLSLECFNVVAFMPPLFGSQAGWEGFPVILRIGDRGSTRLRSSDIGAVDLYAQAVIAADPFAARAQLEGALRA